MARADKLFIRQCTYEDVEFRVHDPVLLVESPVCRGSSGLSIAGILCEHRSMGSDELFGALLRQASGRPSALGKARGLQKEVCAALD